MVKKYSHDIQQQNIIIIVRYGKKYSCDMWPQDTVVIYDWKLWL
jgi:hypothetical protein